MAQILGLPKLSPTMEEGVLAKWIKHEGDAVKPGQVIAEVETDKANMEFAPEDEGVLLKLLVAEGETVALGAPVAILGEQGEDITALLAEAAAHKGKPAAAPAAAAPPAAAAAPAAARPAAAAARPAPAPAKPAAAPAPAAGPAPAPAAPVGKGKTTPAPAAAPDGARTLASPLARRIAAEQGLDLASVQGTGPGGRIVKRDLEGAQPAAAAAEPAATPAPAASTAAPSAYPSTASLPGDVIEKPLSLMRKTIARRLVESKTTIPHFYLTADCDAEPLLAYRAMLNDTIEAPEGQVPDKVSVNDLIIKAASLALRRVPMANASWGGDRILIHKRVHIGMAVAVDDGLLTPVIRDATIKGIATISAEARDLAARARERKLRPEEMTGGTFTVSNLGMFGIDHFEAIINPPEAVILAVGAARKQPVVKGDAVVVGTRMGLTLSCDHRVVDGALGAKLMQALIKILEKPQALAL
ncbi:MAG: pyruvate dehydrogenase complex dihydrolipoamide acetyltransferase [Deltaproteobacteria bacterium]|nr:pyruvate dehydrogenase complex dihydrolipoamide acetyltransferase [Deltaproteobacteria bacterium]